MSKIIIVGGGAAGMMAAIAAADRHKVVLLEKNEKLGKKIYITGKGRCNITNVCDREEFFESVIRNPRFLYSSFDGFTNWDMYAALEEWGLPLKIERGQRVFPESDRSSDVIKILSRRMEELGVEVRLNQEVTGLIVEDGRCIGVTTDRRIYADAVILATGGLSYPSTGSDGDGYRFARECGHKVTPLNPSLVGIRAREAFCTELSGLSLKNISIRIKDSELARSRKGEHSDFGELLFTHKGVSGPLILTLSAYLTAAKEWPKTMYIDLKPAIDRDQLDKRILKLIEENRLKAVRTAFSSLLPAKLLSVVIAQAGLDENKKACDISKAERSALLDTLKGLRLTLEGLCGYNEAVVTSGGVQVSEINPKTMESKLVPGLYIAGELLDIDALTGGYNLQIAWSTGYAAGKNIGE